MPRYPMSFDDGSMDDFPEAGWPAVGEASHAAISSVSAVMARLPERPR